MRVLSYGDPTILRGNHDETLMMGRRRCGDYCDDCDEDCQDCFDCGDNYCYCDEDECDCHCAYDD